MTKSKSYQDDLLESLKDPREAVEYLNAALHDGDPEVFLIALRDVAEALGGVSSLSKKTKLNRENLYRMLSKRGNPQLQSLSMLLEALGFKLSVEVKSKPRSRKRVS
jgi:probable addiction module antidote protein